MTVEGAICFALRVQRLIPSFHSHCAPEFEVQPSRIALSMRDLREAFPVEAGCRSQGLEA